MKQQTYGLKDKNKYIQGLYPAYNGKSRQQKDKINSKNIWNENIKGDTT